MIHTGIETFSVDRLGVYPEQADEPALRALLPDGQYPRNPVTNAATAVVWNADPGAPGDISIFNLAGGGYSIKGHGATGLLFPPITVGG